ncbi:unnamed protein product [Plutella xylostella]|uniref:(diamondback moth) hypothetical protein n=1 Tax=Plutella xylostella TaxID=51655 RepID=A0A8S4FTX5_PLUXY|nr:unnamed protein product [Plutella xylostella]
MVPFKRARDILNAVENTVPEESPIIIYELATSAVSGAWLPGVTSPNLAAAAAAAGVTPPSVGALGKVVTEGARAVDEESSWMKRDIT